MSTNDNSTVLGVVLIVRHGDREGFYQDPFTYTASNTAITPLGNAQLFELGQELRGIYLNPSSSSFISTVNSNLVQDQQIHIRADGGGERGVIFDSAVSLLQGLWPPTTNWSTALSNGSTVTGPLGGYQTVPIESVEPDNDISLEGWTDCNTFNAATAAFYASALFNQTAAEHADFINSLPPFLDGRPATLINMWNIYDFMNVESIHNATFNKSLPATYLAQARDLANFHEWGVFTSPQPNGVGNIGAQTILPSIISSINSITNSSDPLKFVVEAVAYKPFLSLFNVTGVVEMNPQLFGIVNYASAVAYEVRQTSRGEQVIRFKFKNGTDDEFNTYNFLNTSGDVPVQTFINTLKPIGFNDLPTWCKVCNNTEDRGCANLEASCPAASQNLSVHHDRVSPVGAGFIGACITLALMLGALGLLFFTGVISINRGKASRPSTSDVSNA
ncbi:histidine phosphatase superfamily [Gymnopilus junonius]|uniref:Histidine phosphatase superfamily n=1 Tax=Gymnopilus junonius TaxID=109634 RepID=A0A9P5NLG7_GYMJU|nr:histidine phosphatase superfamily [Gymnopilus junonius]